ncbi:MAG: hypothetical protein DKM50_02625 [Candidatus Margulisiibacteriota bacterium]|nr:MAG: hypothetical protein DKM50_02625 [Candidatus Margulisiibacteriota bacterium]HAR62508.1 hypothetical protein [Candidatus Margulisiibacteriota bacterium]HCT86330.1 hypothetical protein [Candidatus Margulisiibacteriota bacterium]HCY38127.1 hypothetical protein [Candidatus Margulisiibacteriota bacterium]
MSGQGQRFVDAGYQVPKPLIEVDGKPIIEHVVSMFPGETDFVFICNSIHLNETQMRTILTRIAPKAKIVEIGPHKKGPVYAVSKIFDLIDDDQEVIINYCDFGKYWDYSDFLAHTRSREADGAIPAYKGFHPHMLGTTNYAFMRFTDQWMSEIREKQPFTDDRMEEYASDGTYYFKKGSYVKKYFCQLIDEDIHVNGEYYVSMVYNLLLKDSLIVSIYEIQHMLQWGTPGDLKEYEKWSDYFRNIILEKRSYPVNRNSITLIPLAGRGNRFATEGYLNPKPLIEVSGKPMIIQSADYLPDSEQHIFVCLGDHLDNYPLEKEIKKIFPGTKIVRLDQVTEGQACTCEIGLRDEDLDSPLVIGACDNGMLWDSEKYRQLLEAPDTDAIVWSFRHNQSSKNNPQMYGWIRTAGDDNVTGVSVKKPISDDPFNDHAIVGTFTFKKARYFIESLQNLYNKDLRVNNEFYVDSCINELIELGYKVKVFEVTDYICWGTPNDLRTYEYWQSFFHKSSFHPYSLDKDITMNFSKISELDKKFRTFLQEHK